MTGAMVITWGSSVRGREAMGLGVFSDALAYFEGLAKQGRIHGHKEYFALTGNTGKLAGMMLIEGPIEELMAIQVEEPTRRLLAKAQAITDMMTVQFYAGGSEGAVQNQVTTYTEELQALGLM